MTGWVVAAIGWLLLMLLLAWLIGTGIRLSDDPERLARAHRRSEERAVRVRERREARRRQREADREEWERNYKLRRAGRGLHVGQVTVPNAPPIPVQDHVPAAPPRGCSVCGFPHPPDGVHHTPESWYWRTFPEGVAGAGDTGRADTEEDPR